MISGIIASVFNFIPEIVHKKKIELRALKCNFQGKDFKPQSVKEYSMACQDCSPKFAGVALFSSLQN